MFWLEMNSLLTDKPGKPNSKHSFILQSILVLMYVDKTIISIIWVSTNVQSL